MTERQRIALCPQNRRLRILILCLTFIAGQIDNSRFRRKDADDLQLVAQSHLVIIEVVRRRNLDDTCAELPIYVLVSDDWDFATCDR